MKCPYCKEDNNMVLDTRDSNGVQKRVRLCLACKRKFKTSEEVANNWHATSESRGVPEWYKTRQQQGINTEGFRKVRDYI